MPDAQFSRRWTVVAEDMPRQSNACDCGVLLSAGMRRLMLGGKRPLGAGDWGFTGADGAVIRLKMAAEIKGRQLLTLTLEEGDIILTSIHFYFAMYSSFQVRWGEPK